MCTSDDALRPQAAAEATPQAAQRAPGVTQLLRSWSAGDPSALDRLVPLVYDELRELARRHLRRERDGHTLRRTALVHEAFLRLVEQRIVHLDSRAQFFGWVSQVMRRVLVSHARKRNAARRGGGAPAENLDALVDDIDVAASGTAADDTLDFIALDDALNRLERLDPRRSQVVELRFFGGLSVEEVAETMQMSSASVKRDWAVARAWLMDELSHTPTRG